jgi:hypothetical protein
MTWTVARDILGSSEGFGLAFKDNLNGLACTFVGGNKISSTSDGGSTWTPISPIPTGLSLFYVEYVNGTPGSYVITSNSNTGGPVPAVPGSAYSNDNGANWNYINNLPYGPVSFSSPNNGWCAGLNDSVYKWVGFPTEVNENSFTADDFRLDQNYPNPFNPSTTIHFLVQSSEFVTLKVFDVLGNEVATLVNEEKPAGSYEVNFKASNLSSGVYLYKLQAGSFIETKKMLLMK